IPALSRLTSIGALWNRILRSRLAPDATVSVEKAVAADAAFDELWDSCRNDAKYSIVRDSKWVNWRFIGAPSRAYTVLLARRGERPFGYLAYSLVATEKNTTTFFAELLAPESDLGSHDTLLLRCIEDSRAARADALVTLAVQGTAEFERLRRVG